MAAVRSAVLVAIAGLLPAFALAQDSVTEFRLVQDPKNIQGCTALDPNMPRVHTLTIKGGQAELKSAGGVDDELKLVRPNVYETVFALAGARLDVVADLSASPKTLTITDKNRGCKWHAVQP
jgi:hypothetical protein